MVTFAILGKVFFSVSLAYSSKLIDLLKHWESCLLVLSLRKPYIWKFYERPSEVCYHFLLSYIVNNSIIAHSCEVETASVTSWWLLPQPLCDVIDHAHICYQILRCSGLVAAYAAPVGLLYHSLQTQSQSCWNKWCLTGDKTQISQEAALNMCLLVYKRIPLLSFVWRCRHRLKFRSCTFYSCVAGNIPFSWIEMHRTLIAALIYPYVWIVNSMLKSLDHQIPLFPTTLLLFIESAQKPQSPQYFSSSCPQSWRNAMHISLVYESSCISAHTTW